MLSSYGLSESLYVATPMPDSPTLSIVVKRFRISYLAGSIKRLDTGCRPQGDTLCPDGQFWSEVVSNRSSGSVAACARGWRLETAGAFVAQEVVAREDVVDLEALRAGVALADVTLQEGLVAHDARALAVSQEGVCRGPAARLAS